MHPEIRKSYLAVQLYYAQRNFHRDRGSYITRNDKIFNYRQSDIKTPALGYAVKIGRQEFIGRHFFLDGFIGGGGRFTFCRFKAGNVYEALNTNIFTCYTAWANEDYYYNYPKHVFDFYLGIRVGYRF